jgi:hypothetical protein
MEKSPNVILKQINSQLTIASKAHQLFESVRLQFCVQTEKIVYLWTEAVLKNLLLLANGHKNPPPSAAATI